MRNLIKAVPFFVIGILIILANLIQPVGGFQLCNNPQCFGFNIAILSFYFLGAYLIYTGIKVSRAVNEHNSSRYFLLRHFVSFIFFIAICLVSFFIVYPIILAKKEKTNSLITEQASLDSHQENASLTNTKETTKTEILQQGEAEPSFEGLVQWIQSEPNNPEAQNALQMIQSGELTAENFGAFIIQKQMQLQEEEVQNINSPSEKALMLATNIFIITSESKESLRDFYNNYSSGDEDTFLAIKNYALYLDSDSERLIIVENVLKAMNKDATAIQNYNPVPSSDNFQIQNSQRCQQDFNKYNTCLSEYNIKMSEYNTCLNETSNPNSWRYSSFCSQPSNFCFKPVCTY